MSGSSRPSTASISTMIDSTNAEASDSLQAGERGPLWIMAPTASGRARPPRAQLGIGAGQSLCDAASHACDAAGRSRRHSSASLQRWPCSTRLRAVRRNVTAIALKWPNDVLIDGSKAPAYWSESAIRDGGMASRSAAASIVHAPADTPYPADLPLPRMVRRSARQALRAHRHAWTHWLELWESGAGFRDIRSAGCRRQRARLGLAVSLDGRAVDGIFRRPCATTAPCSFGSPRAARMHCMPAK